MTIREKLDKHIRFWTWIYLPAFVLFAIVASLASEDKKFEPLVFMTFALAALCIVMLNFWNKCPKCQKNLGRISQWPPSFLSYSKNIKCCPYCGVDLETEIEE